MDPATALEHGHIGGAGTAFAHLLPADARFRCRRGCLGKSLAPKHFCHLVAHVGVGLIGNRALGVDCCALGLANGAHRCALAAALGNADPLTFGDAQLCRCLFAGFGAWATRHVTRSVGKCLWDCAVAFALRLPWRADHPNFAQLPLPVAQCTGDPPAH